MARRATIIKAHRDRGENTLLLDAGDSLLNDNYPAKSSQGASSIAAMNLLQYDAMTLGSLDLTLLSVDELRARIDEAHFPVVSANVFVGDLDKLLVEPYALLEMQGHRIAILGLTDSAQVEGFRIAEPLETVRQWLPELREGADIVILLSHAGIETDKAIAQEVGGIDVIVSGRGANIKESFISPSSGTLIVHADSPSIGEAGRVIGVGELVFDRTGRLLEHTWRKVLLDEEIQSDSETAVWVFRANDIYR